MQIFLINSLTFLRLLRLLLKNSYKYSVIIEIGKLDKYRDLKKYKYFFLPLLDRWAKLYLITLKKGGYLMIIVIIKLIQVAIELTISVIKLVLTIKKLKK